MTIGQNCALDPSKVKLVILCGGMGTRLREETEYRPKPLVAIGEKPILWHIMKIYAHYGFREFILCLGYKGEMIRRYFTDYEILNSDFTLELGNQNGIEVHQPHAERGWKITFVHTGLNAETGARIKRIQNYVSGDIFALTYGDGVADIDIRKLLEFHRSHGKIGTITGTHPMSRFGQLFVHGDRVIEFSEKPLLNTGLINGGFFVLDRRVFDFLSDHDGCIFERGPLEKLARLGQLQIYRHEGFWHCVDTYRDLRSLNEIWNSPNPPWKVWST